MNDQPSNQPQQPEYQFDMTKLQGQTHVWVKRGIKISCENAGHPHHSHFLVKKP